MSTYLSFDPGTIEAIAKVLGEAGSGTDISRYFEANNLIDDSNESTKWRRINDVFLKSQATTKSANQILAFIRSYLVPMRFVGRRDEFEHHRSELNAVLILHGLEYGKDGQFRHTTQARTLDEAEARAQGVRSKLAPRNTHPEVYKYCQPELMQENYFHAVFEACKGLFQRIRDLTGIEADGANLIERAFSVETPSLSFNTLQTETERSEHKGFAQLLKGCSLDKTVEVLEGVVLRSATRGKLIERLKSGKTQKLPVPNGSTTAAIKKRKYAEALGSKTVDAGLTEERFWHPNGIEAGLRVARCKLPYLPRHDPITTVFRSRIDPIIRYIRVSEKDRICGPRDLVAVV